MNNSENQSVSYRSELGAFENIVSESLRRLEADRVMARIWENDHTVWKESPDEITNRLGWLHTPETIRAEIPRLSEFVDEIRIEGFTKVLLLGMGGSSLAPEVFSNIFGTEPGYLELSVLDSTDPAAVLEADKLHDPKETLYIVATKSGGTTETLSFFKYFYNRALAEIGESQVGSHFIAITDPGSKLVDLAERFRFRDLFLNDPNIGGRYAALSLFGLVPAALIGVDLARLMDSVPSQDQELGAAGGTDAAVLAMNGRDKLTFVGSEVPTLIGPWVEQLIAESTGKEGKGILPVSGESIGMPNVYGDDRFFVNIVTSGDGQNDKELRALSDAGHPVAQIELPDFYALGAEFFRWELVTAVASHYLEINPFDQPNVEAAKILAREMSATYFKSGEIPMLSPVVEDDGISITASVDGENLLGLSTNFFNLAQAGDYVAIQAYVHSSGETDRVLQEWRMALRDKLKLATTLGYGPRFLHSTGQLHKGDSGNGLFVQITCDDATDVNIPDEAGSDESSMSFGVLKETQSLGDRQALLDAGRRVIRFHLGRNVVGGIRRLIDVL